MAKKPVALLVLFIIILKVALDKYTYQASPNGTAKRRFPDFVIVGVKKCGTGALSTFLQSHPKVKRSLPAEVHYFNRNLDKGDNWYLSQFPPASPDEVLFEKSADYALCKLAPPGLMALNPQVKIILVVRDPIVRVISDFTQLKKANRNNKINNTVETAAFSSDGSVKLQNNSRLISKSLYSLIIDEWLAVFPRDRILVVDGDSLVQEPWTEIIRVQEFLGLETLVNRTSFVFSHEKGFYCLNKCLGKNKGRQHEEVAVWAQEKLRKYFAPYNREFYRKVGKDFGWR